MELLALKTLKTVVDEGGIKPAAQKLFTVPSNITSRIQKLEHELDTKVFQLVGRKLELTPQGQKLYDYASQMLHLEQQARHAVVQHQGHYFIRVGMPETFAAIHIPLVLQRLKQSYPEIHPRIYTDTSERLLADVLANKIDCGLLGNAPQQDDLEVIPVVREELVIVTPKDGDFQDQLLVREDGCGYRKHAIIWQQENGRGGDELMVISSSEGLLGCVAAGLGYTLIAKDLVIGSRYEQSVNYQPVENGQSAVQISMVYRKGHGLAEGMQKMAELFPQHAKLTDS
jgi:DNA-binding transcriptional LysR family regulator